MPNPIRGRLGQLSKVAERPTVASRSLPLRIRVDLPPETMRALVAAAATGKLDGIELPEGEIPWRSDPIMLTDTPTGDGRTFLSSGADHGPLPLPLMANLSTTWGHDGAENCGRIETIEFDHPRVRASGFFADSDFARDVVRAVVAKNVRGISVDLRDLDGDVTISEDEDGFVVSMDFTATRWKIDGATVTPFPAFDDAEIAAEVAGMPTEDEEPVEPEDVEAASTLSIEDLEVIGDAELPLADREREWDGVAAEQTVRGWASSDGSGDPETIDWSAYARAFFWRDPEADPETFGAYSLGFGEVVDGELVAVPRGIFAVAAVLQGGRGGTEIPEEDQDRIKARVGAYYERMADEFDDETIVAPWAEDEASTVRASLAAAGRKSAVPAGLFEEPRFEELTGPTFDERTGRYFGHAAPFDVCHIGFEDACVCAPRSSAAYAYFLTGALRTDGGQVSVGHVTLGGGHADEDLDWRQTQSFYDEVGLCAADVVVGEDAFGIWFSGRLRPGLSDEDSERLLAHALSGDWRWIGGSLELVALAAVNTPGFPVPRLALRAGERFSLTAGAGTKKLDAMVRESRRPVSRAEYLTLVETVASLQRADALRRIAAGCA